MRMPRHKSATRRAVGREARPRSLEGSFWRAAILSRLPKHLVVLGRRVELLRCGCDELPWVGQSSAVSESILNTVFSIIRRTERLPAQLSGVLVMQA